MSGPRRETFPQSSFPDLRILPIDSLLPHEEHDDQRARPLIERLQRATYWLNPPVVAPLYSSGLYVVLDGANRHFALKTLGYEHILVQAVNYESEAVVLETWHHAVRALTVDRFLPALYAIDGVSVHETSLLNARAALAAREILSYVVMRDSRVFALVQTGDHASRTALLRRVVDAYRHHSKISRITHDEIAHVQDNYPDVIGLVVFPRYDPAEIMVAARDNDLLPPGITRHIIYGRALRLNYPLQELRYANISLEEKNRQLKTWIQERLDAKHIRFYAEPTFVFDE